LEGAREISGKGVEVTLEGKTVLAGNIGLLREGGVDVDGGTCGCCDLSPAECARRDGGTVVHLAEDGEYRGHIVIADQVKDDAREALALLKGVGIKQTVMLTGDTDAAGRKTAADIGIDLVYTELLPADKVERLEALMAAQGTGRRRGTLIFVGDGINDAPVLARADVGIAMGGLGSDAAIEAADAVIMSDEPSRLAAGITIARKTMAVVHQNIVFSLGIKAAVLGLGAAGFASMWLAVFADVGVTFLAVLNSLRLLRE
jgi:Cd2+/Zn2+-exporting ATPase